MPWSPTQELLLLRSLQLPARTTRPPRSCTRPVQKKNLTGRFSSVSCGAWHAMKCQSLQHPAANKWISVPPCRSFAVSCCTIVLAWLRHSNFSFHVSSVLSFGRVGHSRSIRRRSPCGHAPHLTEKWNTFSGPRELEHSQR